MTVHIVKVEEIKQSEEATALLDEMKQLRLKMMSLESMMAVAAPRLALASCPFTVGARLRTNQGLGMAGLEVVSIAAPKHPTDNNRWAINTLALNKEGSVTKRPLCIEEIQMAGCYGLTIEVLK